MLDRPMNYCDRRCELCPQRPGCPIHQVSERRRSLSDVEAMQAVLRDLELANEMLARDLAAAGMGELDLGELEDLPMPAEAKALRDLGMQYAIAMGDLVRAHELEGPLADDLMHFGFQIGAKCASLAGDIQLGLDVDVADVWGSSLLIVELAATRIDAALNALRRTDLVLALEPIHRALNARLAPLMAQVPDELRTLLQTRIDEGVAPSPFSIRDEPWPDEDG